MKVADSFAFGHKNHYIGLLYRGHRDALRHEFFLIERPCSCIFKIMTVIFNIVAVIFC